MTKLPKIVAINLQSSANRRQVFYDTYKNLGIDFGFFDAINGQKLIETPTLVPGVSVLQHIPTSQIWFKNLNYQFCKEMEKGVLGASMSHILVLEQLLLDPNYDAYIIMEDDTHLAQNITKEILHEYLGNIPENVDVIHFNDQSKWWPLLLTTQVNSYYHNIERRFFNCAASYYVTKQGAAKLLKYCRYVISRPPDDLLSNAFIEGHIDVLAPKQPLFTVNYTFPSDVYPSQQI